MKGSSLSGYERRGVSNIGGSADAFGNPAGFLALFTAVFERGRGIARLAGRSEGVSTWSAVRIVISPGARLPGGSVQKEGEELSASKCPAKRMMVVRRVRYVEV